MGQKHGLPSQNCGMSAKVIYFPVYHLSNCQTHLVAVAVRTHTGVDELLLHVAAKRIADDEAEEKDDREDHRLEQHPLAPTEDAGLRRLGSIHALVVDLHLVSVTLPLAAGHLD